MNLAIFRLAEQWITPGKIHMRFLSAGIPSQIYVFYILSEQFSSCREQRNSPKIGRHRSPAFRILGPLHWPPAPSSPPLSLLSKIIFIHLSTCSRRKAIPQSPNGNYSSAGAFSSACSLSLSQHCFYVGSESPACDAAGNYQVKHVASCSAFSSRPLVPHLVCVCRS